MTILAMSSGDMKLYVIEVPECVIEAEFDGDINKFLEFNHYHVMAWCAQPVVHVPVQMDKYSAPDPEILQWSSQLEESKQWKLACKPIKNCF